MNAVTSTTTMSLVAWRRELTIARVGRGYTITVRNLAMAPMLAAITCTSLALSNAVCQHVEHFQLAASNDDQLGSALARFDITAEEAQRIADWAGLDMPRALELLA